MDTTTQEDDDTIVIDSDDEPETEKTSFQTWYNAYLEKMERRYPEAFDLSVKEALRAKSSTNNRKKALKLALGKYKGITIIPNRILFNCFYH